MDECFRDDERLFRAVRPGNMYWKEDHTVSSAAFKTPEKDGLSTDRDSGRSTEECVRRISEKLKGGVVSVSYSQCREVEAAVEYAPVEGNEFHSLIKREGEKTELSNGQAKFLAKNCRIDKE